MNQRAALEIVNDGAEARTGDVNRRDATGAYVYHYSLTQRVFLVFERMGQPLDRKDVMARLNIGAEGLKHAMARLSSGNYIRDVEGRYGFYEKVPGATLPEDTRGKSAVSRGNLRQGRGGA